MGDEDFIWVGVNLSILKPPCVRLSFLLPPSPPRCWSLSPSERPSFHSLHRSLRTEAPNRELLDARAQDLMNYVTGDARANQARRGKKRPVSGEETEKRMVDRRALALVLA